MNTRETWKSKASAIWVWSMIISIIAIAMVGTASAKSLYVNKDLNANSPISAYDIQPAPTYLVYQMTSVPTHYGGAGLAIDTDSEILFVTFEGYGTVDIVNAKTLAKLGTVTAPNANNLAGIVVDQDKQKVYSVDRSTNHLYVYSWDATTKTLTNDVTASPYYIPLTGIASGGAYGIALDEVHDLLYLADLSKNVKIFKTADWSSAGTITVSQGAMGIAVDTKNGLVYTGNAYEGYGSTHLLSKYDLNTNIEQSKDIRTLSGGVSTDNVVGLAVDPATSLLYITTGNQGSGGSDRIIVFDSGLNYLYATVDIGNPTGIAVPGKEISYNPLNLQKTDGLSACANAGSTVTYTLSYDNQNAYDVTGATITDTLPPEVDFVSASNGGTLSGDVVTWNIGGITAGTSGQVTVDVQIKSGTPGGTTITNSATIDTDQTPPTTQSETTDTCTNQPPVAEANGPYTENEGSSIPFSAAGSSDPDGDSLQYRWDFDGDGTWDTAWSSSTAASNTWNDDFSGTATVEVTDGSLSDTDTADVTVNNVAPDITSLSASSYLVQVGTPITVTGAFSDPGVQDTFTASWTWDDGTTDSDPLSAGSTSASHAHTYSVPGVYTICLKVADDDAGEDTECMLDYVVVYDPSAGFVTGGGWINSPAGAYVADPSLIGKANFGFVSKYQKGATTPTGQTKFQFKAGNLNFHSSSYDWLVVAGPKAMYRGSGNINGAGDYGFMLSAIDGQVNGGGGVDKFRIKIWNKGTGEVVYDNQMDALEDADPTTALGGGSIVIHK